MIRRLLTSTLTMTAVAATLVAGAAQAQTDSTKAGVRSGTSIPDTTVRKGNLFSAVSFADSALGAEWSRLRAEAQARYPDLEMTNQEDLHITVVYIGRDWKPEDLDRIRARALVVPAVPVRMTPEVVPLGHNNQVVVVELHGASSVWADSVVVAKDALNRLGLKRPESYDTNFRTHITLAQARHSPPTPADSTELAGFLSWMRSKVAESPDKFAVTIGPTTQVQLLLAGATRPQGAPQYITVEDFLKQHAPTPPTK
jgi:2'-5' RNA ligase